ncbi:MAG: hypothetical protein JRJ83_18155, partial [Deltaproteobacteria bacterium]|nr:hypothetical protein [Deltaproteobacteria bacterium]
GTEFADPVVVTDQGVFGMGLTVQYEEVERLDVDTAEGDDELYVMSTSALVETHLFAGLGSDRIGVAGDAPGVVSQGGIRPAEPGTHTTDAIAGPLFVDGMGGTDPHHRCYCGTAVRGRHGWYRHGRRGVAGHAAGRNGRIFPGRDGAGLYRDRSGRRHRYHDGPYNGP